MNETPEQTSCDLEGLDALLQGTLSGEDAVALEDHLSRCSSCAEQLQRAAVPGTSWNEAQSMLALDEFDGLTSLSSATSLFPAESGGRSYTPTAELLTREICGWLDPSDDPAMLGRFAGYEIVGIIGHGGMGIVLKGFEASLNRYVAIKVLAPRLATNGSARKRFAREAQAAAAVRHDNVIAIHRVDQWHGLPFLTMPYVGGVSLQKRIDAEGPLSIEQTLRVGVQIAAGLAAAHAQGLVHRDIKPANVLLEQGVERVTITDFGLARAADDASVTRTGVIAGTPQYMSPEQAEAKRLDARSDLFSLGSVLYTMCTGRPPFRAETSYDVLRRITDTEPRPIREINPSVPDWLCAIITKLMSKRPDERFASAEELTELLEDSLAHVQQPAVVPLPWRKLPACDGRGSLREPNVLIAERSTTMGHKLPACDSSGRQAGSLPHGRKLWASAQRLVCSPYFNWIAAAAFACALVFAGILIVLETNKGTLTIESDADNVPIRITQGDKVVEKLTVSKSGASIRVAAGQYTVEIESGTDELAIEDGVVILRRGGRDVVKIVKRNARVENAVVRSDSGKSPTESYHPSIYVGGAVKNPSGWSFDPDGKIRLLDAIALVGGLTDDAGDQVIITRTPKHGERNSIKISIARAKTDLGHNLTIAPGDIITVLSEGERAPGTSDSTEVETVLTLQATLVRKHDYRGYLDLLTDNEIDRLAGVMIHQSTVVEKLRQREVNVNREELFWATSVIQRSKLVDPPVDALKAHQQLVETTLTHMLRPGEMETPETYSRLLSTSAGILKDKRQFAVDMMASNPVAAGSKDSVEATPDWKVVVEGDRAFATDSTTLRYPITIELLRVDGHWKISSLFSDDVIMRMVSGAMFIGGDHNSHLPNEAAAKPADEGVSLGIPDAKKLTGTWRGEKDGMAVELTFTTEKEWRMRVSTGRFTLQFNPLVWEFIYDPPSIDLLVKFQHLGGIRDAAPGWDKIGELQDGEGDTLRINLLPRGYERWYKYRPVDGLVLERGEPAPQKTISSGEDDTTEKPQLEVAPGAPERVRQFATAAIGLTIACSADGKLIAVGNERPVLDAETNRVANDWKPTADILDAESGELVVSLQLTTDAEDAVVAATKPFSHFEVAALAFSPDGNVVAVGTSIGQVKLFNARTGELFRSLEGEPQSWATLKRAIGSVSALAFSPDGNLLVTCGQSFADLSNAFDGIYKGRGRLRVWDVKTGAIKHDLVAHDKVRAAVFSPDGKMLASAGSWSGNRDSRSGVIIWNPQTGEQIRRITTNANADLGSAIAFSPNSKLLAIGSLRQASDTSTVAVTMTSALSGDFLWTQTVPQWVRTIAFSPDGKSVAVLSIGKPIQFLDTDNGRVQHEIRPADSEGSQWIDLAIAPQTRTMAISRVDGRQGNIELWQFADEHRNVPNSIEAEDRSGVLLDGDHPLPLAPPRVLDEQMHIRKAIELRKSIEWKLHEVESYEAIIKHHPRHEDLGGITARMQTARRNLATYRDELAAQIRLLELELADAKSAAALAAHKNSDTY